MGQVRYDARKDKDSFIRLPTAPGYSDDGGRILSKQALSAIIDVKVQDILEKIYYRIRDKSLHTQLGYGVVLTGGGATLPGIQRMAKEVFSSHMAGREINVRLGRPLVNYETSELFRPSFTTRRVSLSSLPGTQLLSTRRFRLPLPVKPEVLGAGIQHWIQTQTEEHWWSN